MRRKILAAKELRDGMLFSNFDSGSFPAVELIWRASNIRTENGLQRADYEVVFGPQLGTKSDFWIEPDWYCYVVTESELLMLQAAKT